MCYKDTPGPSQMRKAMGDAAVAAAKAIGYVGVGTIEFLWETHLLFANLLCCRWSTQ